MYHSDDIALKVLLRVLFDEFNLELSDLRDIIKIGEGDRVDFKESPFLRNTNGIEKMLVSFANRHGGKILVGIKDDGTLEGAKINYDEASLAVQNIAINNCSPHVKISFDYVTSLQGDVLLINVHKRNGIPHAIVHRSGHEIRSRTYYIRGSNRDKLVDDLQLQHMFQCVNDPNVSYGTRLTLLYDRKKSNFLQIEFTNYLFYMLPLLQQVRQKDTKFLSENTQKVLLGLLPYAFLIHLSMTFTSSWLVDIKKKGSITTTRAVRMDLPSETVSPADIHIVDITVLSDSFIYCNHMLHVFNVRSWIA